MNSNPNKLFSPIKLGSITLPNRLVQGPLAGYSCAPFRVLTQRYGAPGFCTTEMISAKDLVYRTHKPKRYVWRDPDENIVSYQLSGNDPDILVRASEIVIEHGADIIDLNCGCPVKKIRSRGTGSKLLAQPEMIYDIVSAIKSNTDTVISVKIRVGAPKFDSDDLAVANAAQSAGADFLIVHGRHWTERYDVPCRGDDIAPIVSAVDIPVFANGDVEDTESAIALASKTQCAGVMIARASVGAPWLFEKIRCEILGEAFTPPSFAIIGNVFLEHIQRLSELENDKLAVLHSRKLAKYYSRFLPERSDFITKMQVASERAQMHQLINQYMLTLD